VVPVVAAPVVVVPVVAVPVVVVPVVVVIIDAVRGMMNLIVYRVESTVFTSVTLLPFAIVNFARPFENDPPAMLISIFFALTESSTNTGEAAGKVSFSATSSEVPLVEIRAATYEPC
jgi:hypothetical protein